MISLSRATGKPAAARLAGGISESDRNDALVEAFFAKGKKRPSCSGFLIVELNGVVLACNEAAERVFQRRADQLIGQSVQSLIPTLALRPATPGYNLAYLAFWFPPGVFRLCEKRLCGGDARHGLWVSAQVMRLRKKHHLLITIMAEEPDADDPAERHLTERRVVVG